MAKPASERHDHPPGTVESAHRLLSQVPTDKILVFASGGKDSLVTLRLCVDRYGARNVEAVFMYLVKGLAVEMRPLERQMAKLGGIELHVVPHYSLSTWIKGGALGPVPPNASRIRTLKQRDVEQALIDKTGIPFVARGDRAVESLSKLAMLYHCSGVSLEYRKVYPIYNWRTPAVWSFLKRRDLHTLVTSQATSEHGGGVAFAPESMRWLRDHHPADWAKVEAAFPLVGALAHRAGMK